MHEKTPGYIIARQEARRVNRAMRGAKVKELRALEQQYPELKEATA